ncbi:hypothetical protein EDD61_11645 [Longicatena caecimuris]|uniref:Uncharacterized protein n=1 Tax=Longicatena caecimuris TaxID=1796635 RepID=A0A4R3T863_9FIRM|nr:hypothetical protein HMPREF0984_01206 [Eubacterium sp. 3_1_31]TCU57732.1 hypothetical protein EDD61_11645 [Longicatena caecimuris]
MVVVYNARNTCKSAQEKCSDEKKTSAAFLFYVICIIMIP